MTPTRHTGPQQRRSTPSLHQAAFVSLARTNALLSDGIDQALSARGLSSTQYNVLRILRGAGPQGLCRNEIGERLITRMPDVTRLLDRMEARGLVSRLRSTEDRRLVNTTLTEQGRALVDQLDPEVDGLHREQLGHLTSAELRTLTDLLERARTKP